MEKILKKIDIQSVSLEHMGIAQRRLDVLTKPIGSLGMLEEFALRLCGIYRDDMPPMPKKVVFTFAGDHGVCSEGVSAFPSEVTPQMVYNFLRGGAAINVLARHAGADVVVVDAGVNYDFPETVENECLIRKKVLHGTNNMTKGPAMSKEEAINSIKIGIDLAHEYRDKGYRLFGTGDMGIGNTTPSAAIASLITAQSVSSVTGRGTGINDDVHRHKISVIEKAIELNKPNPFDPIDVLSKVGGAEIGAIAGLCLGAGDAQIPVVIDGFISTAGALIAYSINPMVGQYLFAGHRSQEIGHIVMLEFMKLRPILDLDLRLGEGTGAVLAMILLDAGLKIFREMATFQEAGVSDKE